MNDKNKSLKTTYPNASFTIGENKYKLNEYIQACRERKGHSTEIGARLLGITETEYAELEKGNYPINEEMLNLLIDLYRMPRNLKKLLQNPNRPITAKRITELRVKAGQTQTETGKLLGIPQPTYAGYETGRNEPDISTLVKIADHYHVSMDFLTGRTN
jgi:transcriptional regulator with XRE-family HTH domain